MRPSAATGIEQYRNDELVRKIGERLADLERSTWARRVKVPGVGLSGTLGSVPTGRRVPAAAASRNESTVVALRRRLSLG